MSDTVQTKVPPAEAATIWGGSAIRLKADEPVDAATIWGTSAIQIPDADEAGNETGNENG